MDSPETEIPESEWIRRVQRGEREAFEPLLERHQKRVFSLVYHLVRRRDEVEDIAQEIFIKAFRGIRSYNFQASFGTWLSRIAVNHCYDYLRREQKAKLAYYWQIGEEGSRAIEGQAQSTPEGALNVEQESEARDLAEKLLARAPAEDRTILVLKELEDHSVEEIAAILQLRPNTVKVRLHRARKRMLEDWKRWRQRR
ncbi:MAG TPA: sigma-70 family RNA polymerase sigma factor [Terriglobia bacterium]|nr:sigma-70 family RNA polymerase sigma factor [Terriglobia bacterium]